MDAAAVRAAFPGVRKSFQKAAPGNSTASAWVSTWRQVGRPETGAIPDPVSGTAYDSASVGALDLVAPASGEVLRLIDAQTTTQGGQGVILADRLVASSGSSSTVTTPQAQVMPALPARAGAGVGVSIWIESYVQLGGSGTTYTVSYTNSDGVSGRTTPGIVIPGTFRAGSLMRMPLAPGDVGVQSVQSVTLVSSTGTAGNFGVTLLRQVCSFPTGPAGRPFNWGAVFLGCPVVPSDACLQLVCPATGSVGWPVAAEFTFASMAP